MRYYKFFIESELEKTKIRIIILFFILFLINDTYTQCIKNVQYDQYGEKFLISYDMDYLGGSSIKEELEDDFTVEVFCSTDGGGTYGYPLNYLKGDFGEKQITKGENLILWDASKEYTKSELQGIVLKVQATKVDPILKFAYNKTIERVFTFEKQNYIIESKKLKTNTIEFWRNSGFLPIAYRRSSKNQINELVDFIINSLDNNIIIDEIKLTSWRNVSGEELRPDTYEERIVEKSMNDLYALLKNKIIKKHKENYKNRYDLLCKNELSHFYSIPIKVEYGGEDWVGFMENIENSNLSNKNTMLNVINSMPNRKHEMRNMVLIYPETYEITSELNRVEIELSYYNLENSIVNSILFPLKQEGIKIDDISSTIFINYDTTCWEGLNNLANLYIQSDQNYKAVQYLHKAREKSLSYNKIVENNLNVLWLYSKTSDRQSKKFIEANEAGLFYSSKLSNYDCYFSVGENKTYVQKGKLIKPVLFNNWEIKKYAIIIGVSDYQYFSSAKSNLSNNDLVDLNYAAKDASDFRNLLKNEDLFGTNWEIYTLVDESATYLNIYNKIREVFRKANKDDLIYIFFSGHGKTENNKNVYLLPYDFNGFLGNSINFSGWLIDQIEQSDTEKIILFVDACNSGIARFGKKGQSDDQFNNKLMKMGAHKLLFTSSTSNESSYEDKDLNNGVFTHYLIKGLKGDAPEFNKDSFVNPPELYDYLYKNVTSFTESNQTPDKATFYPINKSFPISIRKK